ncbi:hypothetical protein JTE90_008479 [Oedothorax gibbosus]|uniref:Cyclin-dependent kinase inhibitor domain-containing protein n=1 Tax=Oedothorax gibbosus TaxID=931172 RepID=A0AAV6V0B7_9ARAC|nr:hypothetical protein JTE90_008479 [Oedothorax gibbosus]
MITKRSFNAEEEEQDFVTAKKLCRGVFGFEPKFLPQESSARRNLFASDDNEDSKNNSNKIVCQLLTEATRTMSEHAAKVWNFDFLTETPLEGGRYKWERVQKKDVPEWYTHTSQSTKVIPSPVEEKQNSVLVPVSTNNVSNSVKCNSKRPKLVQTSIKGWASRVQKEQRRTSTRLKLKKLDDGCSPRLLTHYILRGSAKSS